MNNAFRLHYQIILSTQQNVARSPSSLVPCLRLHFAIFSRHLSVLWFISGELILFQPSTSCQINGRRVQDGLKPAFRPKRAADERTDVRPTFKSARGGQTALALSPLPQGIWCDRGNCLCPKTKEFLNPSGSHCGLAFIDLHIHRKIAESLCPTIVLLAMAGY